MRRPLVWILTLLLIASATAFGQGVQVVEPTLVFDDASFDYLGENLGYLHFSRDLATNVVTVRLTGEPLAGSLPLVINLSGPETVNWLQSFARMREMGMREMAGILVWENGLEIPIPQGSYSFAEVSDYFHEVMSDLGFLSGAELFAVDTYSYLCTCPVHIGSHARVMIDPSGDPLLVRFMLDAGNPMHVF